MRTAHRLGFFVCSFGAQVDVVCSRFAPPPSSIQIRFSSVSTMESAQDADLNGFDVFPHNFIAWVFYFHFFFYRAQLDARGLAINY